MEIKTHKDISAELCGRPVELSSGRCLLRMKTVQAMRADEAGLVHGGFVFGMADYAAMLAVNHPFVVLGAAESSFLKPVSVGDELEALAELKEEAGRKRKVEVTVSRDGAAVMTGLFTCFVLDKHVLEK